MDDKTLLELIKSNDDEAFGLLMRRYYGAIFSFARRILNDSAAAEDTVQEVFANLWIKRRRIIPEPSLRSFLYASARNTALNHIRTQKRQGALEGRYMDEYMAGLAMIEDEKNRLLSEAIGRLPARTAEVIRLSHEGLPQEQIAHQMGITVATVKLLKSRGIQKLKEILGPLSFILFF